MKNQIINDCDEVSKILNKLNEVVDTRFHDFTLKEQIIFILGYFESITEQKVLNDVYNLFATLLYHSKENENVR